MLKTRRQLRYRACSERRTVAYRLDGTCLRISVFKPNRSIRCVGDGTPSARSVREMLNQRRCQHCPDGEQSRCALPHLVLVSQRDVSEGKEQVIDVIGGKWGTHIVWTWLQFFGKAASMSRTAAAATSAVAKLAKPINKPPCCPPRTRQLLNAWTASPRACAAAANTLSS